jgi:hypothetical protein
MTQHQAARGLLRKSSVQESRQKGRVSAPVAGALLAKARPGAWGNNRIGHVRATEDTNSDLCVTRYPTQTKNMAPKPAPVFPVAQPVKEKTSLLAEAPVHSPAFGCPFVASR